MRLIGQLEHGLYIENNLTIHPEVINHYYGSRTDQVELQAITELDDSQNGGDDNEWEDVNEEEEVTGDIASCIADEQASQFLHKAANVPKQTNPFNNQDLQAVFQQALNQVQGIGHTPNGLGIRKEEWDSEGYPEVEVIHSNYQGQKDLMIELPHSLWYPRAIKWCQGLEVLNHTLALVDHTV